MAGQPLWQPSARDIDLIRHSWSDDFGFLYDLGTDIYAFIFESAPQSHHLFPAMIAAGDDWRERAAKKLPMGKLGQVDEIADFVVFLLSERSGVVTGSVIDWDQNVFGGLD